MKRLTLLLAMGAAALAGCAPRSSVPSEVKIEVTDDGFAPTVAYVPKGRPFTLLVTRHSDETCATSLVLEKTKQKYRLPLEETVRIELPAAGGDTVWYTCGMGMYRSALVPR